MDQAIVFVKQLLEAFLAGFGIATVVNVFVFPTTARKVVFKQCGGYIQALQGVIKTQLTYVEKIDLEPIKADENSHGDLKKKKKHGKSDSQPDNPAKIFKDAIKGLAELHGKLHGDMTFAKRELAYGHLDAKEIDELFQLFRAIFLPLLGMSTIVDIFERLVDQKVWGEDAQPIDGQNPKDRPNESPKMHTATEDWKEIMQALQQPFEAISAAMIDGLNHVSYVLQFTNRPKEKAGSGPDTDVEAHGGEPKPGDREFHEILHTRVKDFSETRKRALRVWCTQQNIPFPGEESDNQSIPQDRRSLTAQFSEGGRQQLYLILYMESLLMTAAGAVEGLVNFADSKVESGVMEHKRFLFPGKKRFKKWVLRSFSVEDVSTDHTPDTAEVGLCSISLGEAFQKRKDLEHLPPTGRWQRFGDAVRKVFHVLGSPEVAFGFRVACATMSIAIIAFLEQTQAFFIQQRIVWAMIMVAIGMAPVSDSSMPLQFATSLTWVRQDQRFRSLWIAWSGWGNGDCNSHESADLVYRWRPRSSWSRHSSPICLHVHRELLFHQVPTVHHRLVACYDNSGKEDTAFS